MASFSLKVRKCKGLDDEDNDRFDAFGVVAVISLSLSLDDGYQPFPFRLDTGTDVSVIPAKWVPYFSRLFRTRSKSDLHITTLAGPNSARGRFVRIDVKFPDAQDPVAIDFLLCETLEKRGLLSLKDVMQHFYLESSGPFNYIKGSHCGTLGELKLKPRVDSDQK